MLAAHGDVITSAASHNVANPVEGGSSTKGVSTRVETVVSAINLKSIASVFAPRKTTDKAAMEVLLERYINDVVILMFAKGHTR